MNKEKDRYNNYEQMVLEKIDKSNKIIEKYFVEDIKRKNIENQDMVHHQMHGVHLEQKDGTKISIL